jgi:hypothetical protein
MLWYFEDKLSVDFEDKWVVDSEKKLFW